MNDKSASQQIDDIINQYGGWKGNVITRVRAIIKKADPDIVEEIKWKMPSMPEGLPVWSHNGIVCILQTFKNNSKLVFFQGAKLDDPDKLFNARLESSSERAIEFHEGDTIDDKGISALVVEAVKFNINK